jgi:hypothetical protein
MLARPFRSMSRSALVLLLLVLVILELVLGTGLYVSTKGNTTAATATATPPPFRACNSTGKVENYPRTVLIGQYETFSVCLHGLKNQVLTYTLSYPDGTTQEVKVLSDKTGYSKERFLIKYKPQGLRDSVGIGVSYQDKVQIATRFAVQNPNYKQ